MRMPSACRSNGEKKLVDSSRRRAVLSFRSLSDPSDGRSRRVGGREASRRGRQARPDQVTAFLTGSRRTGPFIFLIPLSVAEFFSGFFPRSENEKAGFISLVSRYLRYLPWTRFKCPVPVDLSLALPVSDGCGGVSAAGRRSRSSGARSRPRPMRWWCPTALSRRLRKVRSRAPI
jgi:hypothetical protein